MLFRKKALIFCAVNFPGGNIVSTAIGNAGINISQMRVSQGIQRGGKAMMALCLSEPLATECYQRILAIPDMYQALIVKLTSS